MNSFRIFQSRKTLDAMSRFLFIPLFLLIVQSVRGAEDAPAKGISIRLFAAALAKDQGAVCILAGDARGAAFELPTQNLSDSQITPSRNFLIISASAAVDPPPAALASIRLPEQGADFRIILVPAADGSYKPVVIRGDDPKFSHGDFFFINLSTHAMLGVLGTTRIDLKPGSQEIIRPSGAKSDSFFEVKFAHYEQQKLLPLTDSCWPIVKDNRSYIIFYNGKGGRPAYRAVDEFLAVAPGG